MSRILSGLIRKLVDIGDGSVKRRFAVSIATQILRRNVKVRFTVSVNVVGLPPDFYAIGSKYAHL